MKEFKVEFLVYNSKQWNGEVPVFTPTEKDSELIQAENGEQAIKLCVEKLASEIAENGFTVSIEDNVLYVYDTVLIEVYWLFQIAEREV